MDCLIFFKTDLSYAIPIVRFHDLVLAPFYLGLLIVIAFLIRKKYTKKRPELKKYFLPALTVRFIGCFCFILLYMYYYEGGDSWAYNWGAIAIWRTFWHDPILFFQIMFNDATNYPIQAFGFFQDTYALQYLNKSSNVLVMKIAAILHLFNFQSYVSTSLILSFLSFLSCWKIFEVFTDLYPKLHKYFAMAILFVPSLFFWGAAGLLKDCLVLISVGFLFWGAYQFFIKRKYLFKSFVYIILGAYVILVIKIYVLMALLPALFIWVMLFWGNKISNRRLRLLIKPFILLVSIIGGTVLLSFISAGNKQFSSANILETIKVSQDYLKYQTEEAGGTGYELGDWDPTILGITKMIPKAINVTLFRPYIWETRKPVLLPSVFESVLTLFLTIWVIFKVGFFRCIKLIFNNPTLLFCFTFALAFAFAVGFSTYNFGSLARYKIPGLPFYFSGLVILYGDYLQKRKRKLQVLH